MTTGSRTPTTPGRSRLRTFLPLGVAAWLVLEIWLLTVVADAAGGLTVLALLVGGAVLGAFVIKRAGRRAFARLSEALQRPQEAAGRRGEGDGLMMLGGLLLMLPGLISDVLGLVLLLPPVRGLLGRATERSLERRMNRAAPGGIGEAFQQARMHRPDGKVVQGEVIREDGPAQPGDGEDRSGPRPPLAS
ncbi:MULTISPECIES: FxsA family membrane protein [unclassified Streptomyces]|uniref:FxsA family membrane protein n=1 Tax=unclassified Streptomyces TaxID=2593676 RepID=UPI0037F52D99